MQQRGISTGLVKHAFHLLVQVLGLTRMSNQQTYFLLHRFKPITTRLSRITYNFRNSDWALQAIQDRKVRPLENEANVKEKIRGLAVEGGGMKLGGLRRVSGWSMLLLCEFWGRGWGFGGKERGGS